MLQGIFRVVLLLAFLCLNQSVFAQLEDASISDLRKQLEVANDPDLSGEIYERIITAHMRVDTDSMYYFAEQFNNFANRQNDDLLRLKALYHLGRYHAVKGEGDEAIKYFEDAYAKLETSTDPSFQGKVIGMMGYTYYSNGQYDFAIRYYEESLTYFRQANDQRSTAIAISTIGSIYYQLRDFDAAKAQYLESLEIKEELKDSVLMSTDLTNIGLIYQREGKLDSALVFSLKALEIDQKFNNQFGIADIYGDLSSIYREQGSLSEATYYATRSLEVASSVNSLPLIRDAHQLLYVTYQVAGNLHSALFHHEEFKAYSDSIINISTQQELVNAQEKYESQKKEQEILLLEAENKEAQLKVTIAILVAVSFIIILSVAYWQTTKRKERERALQVQSIQKELENYGLLINEKDSFINEVIDKLKNFTKELKTFESKREMNTLIDSLHQNVKLTDDEDQLFHRIEQINSGFFRKLDNKTDSLTKGERRLASLVQMDLSNKEIGSIIGINAKSVTQARYRLKKKLSLEPEEDLAQYLKQLG
ncbi:MAG: tetratricopeptide repeat protein [Balneolaceae bacterium]|nr:tetratricopeptide repeat protein [Balneolaceae bacterium]MBO6546084.1 tetratricopeptide repeat protein [Balneolaceae bacterium]MBO6647480.1 tetratricopeptide repeat protein [Balneolaceae bacterium]